MFASESLVENQKVQITDALSGPRFKRRTLAALAKVINEPAYKTISIMDDMPNVTRTYGERTGLGYYTLS